MYIYERQPRAALGQAPGATAPSGALWPSFDPEADYQLDPRVMGAVAKLLATPIPQAHLAAVGQRADPLLIERGLTIYRYADGSLEVGQPKFGASPRKLAIAGSTQTGTSTRYSVELDTAPWPRLNASTGVTSEAPPWLFVHTHPQLHAAAEVPSGIQQENSRLAGDLYILRHQPAGQLGIITIGLNTVIPSLGAAAQPIPFSLALRGPIKGPTSYRATELLATHKAAANALRMIFRRPTVRAYFTGDLRSGKAAPYSAAQQRQLKKAGG